MKSPLTVNHSDMIKEAERQLDNMKKYYPAMVIRKEISPDTATKRIATQESILKFLRQHKPSRQLELGERK